MFCLILYSKNVQTQRYKLGRPNITRLHYMLLVRRFYPKRLTYSILWAIPTGAIWGEVSQGHTDMLTAVGFEPPDLNTKAQPTAPHASSQMKGKSHFTVFLIFCQKTSFEVYKFH